MTTNDKGTALMFACRNNNSDCVALLVEEEAGMSDYRKRTALHYACVEDNVNCASLLLDREAECVDGDGKTPLMLAKKY